MKDRLKWAALACATSLLTASLLTGPIGAQTVRDDDSPAASLKLPSNITLFGKSDPVGAQGHGHRQWRCHHRNRY